MDAPTEPADVVATAAQLLLEQGTEPAAKHLIDSYPSRRPDDFKRRSWTKKDLARIFGRDRYRDRYSGSRLVFPGALRLLTLKLGDAFPYHPNWKQSETHPAYWDLSPTIDHIEPLGRGGQDVEDNIATTSMLMNSAKSNWRLDELRWTLRPVPASDEGWDGMTGWFRAMVERDPKVLLDASVADWPRALA